MNRNIYVLLVVRIVANFVDSFYFLASIWFVKENTDSTFWIGLVGFVAMIPVAFQFLYGPLIDRYSKKVLLLISMGVQATILMLLATLYMIDRLTVGGVITLLFIATLASELSYPTEHALVPVLVKQKDLQKVNSLFAFTYHSLDVVCNALAGIVLTFIGVGLVYTSNAFLYLLLCAGIGLALRIDEVVWESNKENRQSGYYQELKEGFRYFWNLGFLRRFILVFTLLNLLITISLGLLPILAPTEFLYGSWLTAISIGTLIGSAISMRLGEHRLRLIFIGATSVGGMTWLISSIWLTTNLKLVLFFFAISWIAIGMMGIQFQTLLQRQIEASYLGRTLTVIYAVQGVLAPFGYLLGGTLADFVSHLFLYVIGAITLLLAGLYFVVDPFLKQVSVTSKE